MSSGIAVDDACVTAFNEMKTRRTARYVVYRIENNEKIVIDCQGAPSENYADFVAKLPSESPRYAVVDFDFTTSDGRPQSKLVFVAWTPEECPVKQKMVYAATTETLKSKLQGFAKAVQAHDSCDMEAEEIKRLFH